MTLTLNENHILLQFEQECRTEGFCFIAGVDEAGRGPLAGPVVAAAVVLPQGVPLPAVNDSKQLTEAERLRLRDEILTLPGVQTGLGVVDAETIDVMNILNATHLAMRTAVEQLRRVDFLLIDGRRVRNLPWPSRALVKGDARSASIAAASILAKVHRDELMIEFDRSYPGYGFAEHKGYGTEQHMEALRRLGICPIHRRTFRPVREILCPPPEQLSLFD